MGWCNDLQEGNGVESWQGGSRFEGCFKGGQKEGWGLYVWPDGSTYHGTWQSNSINGVGYYVGSDGRWFKGEEDMFGKTVKSMQVSMHSTRRMGLEFSLGLT